MNLKKVFNVLSVNLIKFMIIIFSIVNIFEIFYIELVFWKFVFFLRWYDIWYKWYGNYIERK